MNLRKLSKTYEKVVMSKEFSQKLKYITSTVLPESPVKISFLFDTQVHNITYMPNGYFIPFIVSLIAPTDITSIPENSVEYELYFERITLLNILVGITLSKNATEKEIMDRLIEAITPVIEAFSQRVYVAANRLILSENLN